MNRDREDIIYRNGKSWTEAWEDTSNGMPASNDDIALFELSGTLTRALNDLDEVRNDPSLADARKVGGRMINEYRKRAERLQENEKFISDILSGSDNETNIAEEIRNIRLEINEKHISELTAEWVKDWHEKRQKGSVNEVKNKEIKDFITSSLFIGDNDTETVEEDKPSYIKTPEKSPSKRRPFRYITYSAAAAMALFLSVRLLIPSSSPEKLYDRYYKPFEIISPVTRSAANSPGQFAAAVNEYKLGEYHDASIAFAGVVAADTNQVAPKFYLAMSEMAAGNSARTITLLNEVLIKGGEYNKEACWYLGLAYLKSGESAKAKICLEKLAGSPGYYSERASDLLRRLR